MDRGRLEALLADVAAGTLTPGTAAAELTGVSVLPHSSLDVDRDRRIGHGEVVYGEGKSVAQVAGALRALHTHHGFAFATRLDEAKAHAVTQALGDGAQHDAGARIVWIGDPPVPVGRIAVVSAGTSDESVAAEVAAVAKLLGNGVLRVTDVGVAGLHRVLQRAEELRACTCVVVVAGMDGALPSVVGGLVGQPVIAVPTSVGYGASFGGVAALLSMLNSCAPGVTVVNIDNGFGAAYAASRVNRAVVGGRS